MKPFEAVYLGLEPFYPSLWRRVRAELRRIAGARPGRFDILDVGGRKSHYTIGVPASISVSDILRRTNLQESLNLGATESLARQLLRRRSNVRWYLYDDMTQSSLRSGSFDCVVAVEVLEHVERDADFVREVSRVLKPGGVFLMTTPNGDHLPVPHNPDHKRHYKRAQLQTLLAAHFSQARVEYAVRGGTFRRWGLRSWSLRRPLATALSMAGNLINHWQSGRSRVRERADGTHHLIAFAKKSG